MCKFFNLLFQCHVENPQFEAFVLKVALRIIMLLCVLFKRHGCFIFLLVTNFLISPP
jgi:hypothetical protein